MTLNDFVDWFIPADIARDRQNLKQVRMFLISHLFGPFIGNTVPLALYVFDPDPGYPVLVLALSISAFWLFPFVLRAWGHYNALALASIQNLNFCILWSCYFYGGITSPTLPWVLTIPLLALFYIGSEPRLRVVALSLFAANLAAFGAIWFLGGAMPSRLDVAAREGLGLVSTIAASLYVAMMALFYARLLASQSELETAMQGHMQTAAELRDAIEATERAGAARTEFIARMSHELRTPLNAVIGYSEILLEEVRDEGDEDTARDLARIQSSGHLLLKLVNEILDLAKIEAGKMELHLEAVDPAEIVASVADEFREPALAAGTRITLDTARAPRRLLVDKAKLRQILAELVVNAIKFTRDGRIDLIAATSPRGHLTVAVRDTGGGIDPELMPVLFEQFTDAGDANGSKYGGARLGLALSRKIARLSGGEIVVENRPGIGSTFTLTLPDATTRIGPTAAARSARALQAMAAHA
ncbi:sensor histidine kinase KdpD [Bosea sp. (in: a-proteobacteria)]|uniref:sensor histidine kinase n=1 Tax=Bosea sp. (in: a-proteobacteria) TaxID=1871050 RepID=UPI0026372F7D|nr:HAMP domain-containing sensor histidine kinase [Bosea sp. (in: a-proteobacteria)]MCO5093556.1 HAMP domain-containing histidine kinase [Bosea sp. (in: a-proteobacteria)]